LLNHLLSDEHEIHIQEDFSDALFNRSMDHDRRRGRADGSAHRGVRADSDTVDFTIADADGSAAATGYAATDHAATDDAADAAANDAAADDAAAHAAADDSASDNGAAAHGAAGGTGGRNRREDPSHRGARITESVDDDA
jgi:hypothetical protein